jgi:hypothetical protein
LNPLILYSMFIKMEFEVSDTVHLISMDERKTNLIPIRRDCTATSPPALLKL